MIALIGVVWWNRNRVIGFLRTTFSRPTTGAAPRLETRQRPIDGQCKLTDFGAAVAEGDDGDAVTRSRWARGGIWRQLVDSFPC